MAFDALNPLSSSLLDSIANPKIADPYAAYQEATLKNLMMREQEEKIKASREQAKQQAALAPFQQKIAEQTVGLNDAQLKEQEAKQASNLFTSIMYDNATTFLMPDDESQKQFIGQMTNKYASHPGALAGWNKLASLPFDERNKMLIQGLETGVKAGVFPQPRATSGGEGSDTQNYAELMAEQYELETGEKIPPGDKAELMKEYRRAQALETQQVSEAKKVVDVRYAEQLAANSEMGTQLAMIATAGDLIVAKGEITAKQKQINAKTRLEADLAMLASHYVKLDSMGAIANTKKGSVANTAAAIRSSKLGQQAGRILGTDAQSLRQSIENMRPLLIQEIRQATDMGVRGIDSDRELTFYMQAATDPSRDIQSNLAALSVLSEAHGGGKASKVLERFIDQDRVQELRDQGATVFEAGKGMPPVEFKNGQMVNMPDISQLNTSGAWDKRAASGWKPEGSTPVTQPTINRPPAASVAPPSVSKLPTVNRTPPPGKPSAPPAAIEELRANPALKSDFIKAFGYLPEGF